MIRIAQGNVLDAEVEALVNTVNTVGVMGKGVALMFKEAYPDNFRQYAAACKRGEVRTGRMFVTELPPRLDGGPRWIVNFPTKQNWRGRTRMEWITEGLRDLRRFLVEQSVASVAIPPLGCGAGGLDWADVRPAIEAALADLHEVRVVLYEPTSRYPNVAKQNGAQVLTPARAMIAELVRRYWVLGIECSLLEIQKMAWFLERAIEEMGLDNPLNLACTADRYGPYSDPLRHLLNHLDGSFLHCSRRLADARPADTIWFDDSQRERLASYLQALPGAYQAALDAAAARIDGFQSPLGLELLATVDWLLHREGVAPDVESVRAGLARWPAGHAAAVRKQQLFDDRLLQLALQRLSQVA